MRIGAVALGSLFWSCRHSPIESAQGNAAQVTRAVEMLRLSSKHDKTLWVKRLRELPCQSPDVCELQNTCVNAYDEYLGAITAIDLLRKDLLSPEADASAADASAELYLQAAVQAQSAQRALVKSRQPMRNCAENEAVIRQRYKIR